MPVSRKTDASAGALRAASAPRFARSGQMVDCLRRDLLYSEKRARDILFAVIENLVSTQTDEPMIVARLTREATRLARIEGERTGYVFSNWNNAGKAVVKAMIASESLVDPDGSPIRFGVTVHAATVGSLREDYRDRTEAFLLEFLLRRLGDVTVHDHTALAHALFRYFDPSISMNDLEDRVAILLARLADRVTLVGDMYTVREVGDSAQPVHA